MPSSAQRFALDQFHRALERTRGAAGVLAEAHPPAGWVKAIRAALGMTGQALARRLGVTPATVRQYEIGEQRGTITLATLRRVADALDADLVYALVPRAPLAQIIDTQARKLARERIAAIAQTMALEAQGLQDDALARRIDALAAELASKPRELWR